MARVGIYSKVSGLAVNSTLVMTYKAGEELPMTEVRSQCIDFRRCGSVSRKDTISSVATPQPPFASTAIREEHQTILQEIFVEEATERIPEKKLANDFGQVYAHHRFGMTSLIPLHHKGNSFFSCGTFFSEAVFQNLVALIYALWKINANEAGIGLGAVIFDYCDRVEKAREQYFSFYSGETETIYDDVIMTRDRIVASVNFKDEASEAVSSILSSNFIPHFNSPVGGRKLGDRTDETLLTSVPSRTAELRTIISILKSFNWKFVSTIYDDDKNGHFMVSKFREFANEKNICVGESLGTAKLMSIEYAMELVDTLSLEWKPKVIIILMDDTKNIRTLLSAFQELNQSENFVFISSGAWGNKVSVVENLDRISAGAITFTMETYDLPEFRSFMSNLTLKNHDPVPKIWFEEYFQFKHECSLSLSSKPMSQFAKECTGQETIHPDNIIQDPFVFHTILNVNAIAHGLDSYMSKECFSTGSINECDIKQAELALEIMNQGKLSLNNTNRGNSANRDGSYGYHIWNYRKVGKEYGYVNVGKWENGELRLETANIEFKIGSFAPVSVCIGGPCVDVCSSQSVVYAAMRLPQPLPIDYNFKNVYGIVTSSLSLLGIVMILITLIYFMMTFPTAEGTSVLGYIILIGCLMIYAVNFAFIFQPTVGTCAVRRFMTGLSYAIVFSAMLVRVIHAWRITTYGDEDGVLSKPGILILICSSLILVQVILGAAWLILYPPGVDLLGNTWRCTPTDSFESELIISLVYVMILMAATLLFCFETWQYHDSLRETRWILLATLFNVFAWLLWAVVATQAPLVFRDPAVVVGNLTCATVILLFLYVRRFYIYSQLSEDVKDLEMRSHFTAASTVYNASLADHIKEVSRTPTINPIREAMPGRQFVGDQEVSFRTVTLPPEEPCLSRYSSRASRMSRDPRGSRPPSRPPLRFSFSEEPPGTDLEFESSSEEFAMDTHPFTEEEDGELSSFEGREDGGAGVQRDKESPEEEVAAEGRFKRGSVSLRNAPIRRVGSRQMLVFLTDGNSIGEVSRI